MAPGCEVPPAVILVREPTALTPLCGIPLLQRTFLTLHTLGVQEVCILTSEQMEAIRATFGDGRHLGLRIRLVNPAEEAHVLPLPQRRVLVLEGNTLWDERLLRLLCQQDGSVVVIDSESENTCVWEQQ